MSRSKLRQKPPNERLTREPDGAELPSVDEMRALLDEGAHLRGLVRRKYASDRTVSEKKLHFQVD